MVRRTCANEFCLYSFKADEEESEELPFCEWCLQRKMKVRMSLGQERERALQELKEPWRGYRRMHVPAAITAKRRERSRATSPGASPPSNVSEKHCAAPGCNGIVTDRRFNVCSPQCSQAIVAAMNGGATGSIGAPAAVRLPVQRRSSLKATIAASPPPRSTSMPLDSNAAEHPAVDGVKSDPYFAAQPGQDATPSTPTAQGLPSLEKQLKTAEANLRQFRGSDPTALATKSYMQQQIAKLKQDIYESKSLADQVLALQARVLSAEAATLAADKALQAANEVRSLRQKALDAATAEEEDLRNQHHQLQARLHREQDAERLQAASSPTRRISEQLPDSAADLIATIKFKKDKGLLEAVFIQLAQESAILEDFNLTQFTEHLSKIRAEHQVQQATAPRLASGSAPVARPVLDDKSWLKTAPFGPANGMEVDGSAPPAPPGRMPRQVPPMPTFSPGQTERFTIASDQGGVAHQTAYQADSPRDSRPPPSPAKSDHDIMRECLSEHLPDWLIEATSEHHIEVLFGAHGLPGIDPDDRRLLAGQLSHLEGSDLSARQEGISEAFSELQGKFPAYFEAVIPSVVKDSDPQAAREAQIQKRACELQGVPLFNLDDEQLTPPALQAILVKANDEVIALVRFAHGVNLTIEDVEALCKIHLFAKTPQSPTSSPPSPSPAASAGVGVIGAPWNTEKLKEALSAGSASAVADTGGPSAIPALQPAFGPGIPSEDGSSPVDQDQSELNPRGAKLPFGKASTKTSRVSLKDKDRSESDIKEAHALKAKQLSAANTSTMLQSLRAKDSPLSGVAADMYQELFPEQPAQPSPRSKQPVSDPGTPTQLITSDASDFREGSVEGAAT